MTSQAGPAVSAGRHPPPWSRPGEAARLFARGVTLRITDIGPRAGPRLKLKK